MVFYVHEEDQDQLKDEKTCNSSQKMLESRPEDALVTLVKTVETVETAEPARTADPAHPDHFHRQIFIMMHR